MASFETLGTLSHSHSIVTGDNPPGDNSPGEDTPYRKYPLEVTPDPQLVLGLGIWVNVSFQILPAPWVG